jgi:putative hydrolase of the HAD superfamily
MIRSIDAVGFDIDGTLYPESMMYFCSIPSFLRDPLLMFHFGRMRRKVRTASRSGADAAAALPRDRFRSLQARLILQSMGREVTQKTMQDMLDRIDRHIYGVWMRSFSVIRPFRGVPEVFDHLRGMGLKTGLLSDFPPGGKPRALGVDQRVDVICSAEDAGELKPHDEPFMLLARELQVEDLSRMLYVGNSYTKDIEGAKAAGMRTAYFMQHPGRVSAQRLSQTYPAADLIFSSYERFPQLVSERFGDEQK